MKKTSTVLFSILLAFVVLAGVNFLADFTRDAQAESVTNYYTHTVASGSTAYTSSGGNLTGWDVSGFGSAVVHVIADASLTTSTLTIYPQYSNEIANCTAVSNWFTGTDYIAYATGAGTQVVVSPPTLASSTNNTDSLSFTGTTTGSAPYVVSTTYTYNAATVTTYTVSSAAAGYASVQQSLATTGDDYDGKEFRIYGRCMRLHLTVSAGTVTPTIYVQERDSSE